MKYFELTAVVKKLVTSRIVSHGIPQGGIKNLTKIPADKPYLIWTHDAQKYRPLTVKQALGIFGSDEVGSPQIEVTALYLQYPEYFINRGINAAGSTYESGSANGIPFILVYDTQQPGFHVDWVDMPGDVWGALSRGKEVVKLGV